MRRKFDECYTVDNQIPPIKQTKYIRLVDDFLNSLENLSDWKPKKDKQFFLKKLFPVSNGDMGKLENFRVPPQKIKFYYFLY